MASRQPLIEELVAGTNCCHQQPLSPRRHSVRKQLLLVMHSCSFSTIVVASSVRFRVICVGRLARHAQDVALIVLNQALCARASSSSSSCCHSCASASSHSSCSLRLGSVALVEPVAFVERVASRLCLRRRLSLARFRWRLREVLPLLAPRPVLPSPAGIANVLVSSSAREAPQCFIRFESRVPRTRAQQPLKSSCRKYSGSAARSPHHPPM